MESVILALAITGSVLLISSITSPKLRAMVSSVPIPITVLLLGTGGHVNITYLAGLIFTLAFMASAWLLYKKLHIPLLVSITLSLVLYVLLGTLNRFIVDVPFLIGYFLFAVFWLLYLIKPIRLTKVAYRKVPTGMNGKDYVLRSVIVFVLAYAIIGVKGLIFGAAITFPFNSMFTVYVMEDQLPVLITEQIRNFFGLFTFFLVIWLLQPRIGLILSVAAGWAVAPVMIYGISRYVPRRYKEA